MHARGELVFVHGLVERVGFVRRARADRLHRQMQYDFLVVRMRVARQFAAVAGAGQDRVGVIALEFDRGLAVVERVTEVVDDQRQYRSLVGRARDRPAPANSSSNGMVT